jgi:adenosine kinase
MGDASSLTLEKFDPAEHFIVISPHDPGQMKKQVAECAAKKLRMFYDVGQQANNISAEDIREGIAAAELLIVNDYEMGVLAQKTGWSEAEIKQKVPACVVTLGEKGCVIHHQWHKDGPIEVKACAVEKVADPTGAGDAFRAGFLFGYIRQWPITQCAQLGAVTAAYAVENMGTQGHHPTKEEITKRYITTYGEPEVRW